MYLDLESMEKIFLFLEIMEKGFVFLEIMENFMNLTNFTLEILKN